MNEKESIKYLEYLEGKWRDNRLTKLDNNGSPQRELFSGCQKGLDRNKPLQHGPYSRSQFCVALRKKEELSKQLLLVSTGSREILHQFLLVRPSLRVSWKLLSIWGRKRGDVTQSSHECFSKTPLFFGIISEKQFLFHQTELEKEGGKCRDNDQLGLFIIFMGLSVPSYSTT